MMAAMAFGTSRVSHSSSGQSYTGILGTRHDMSNPGYPGIRVRRHFYNFEIWEALLEDQTLEN